MTPQQLADRVAEVCGEWITVEMEANGNRALIRRSAIDAVLPGKWYGKAAIIVGSQLIETDEELAALTVAVRGGGT